TQPVSETVADQQRQVRVVEADHRNVQPPPRVQRGPGSHVGVADLDQVWTQRAQQIAPGPTAYRKAITLAEGQHWRRDFINAGDVTVIATRDQYAVAHPRKELQATQFDFERGQLPTTGRCAESRHVGEDQRI